MSTPNTEYRKDKYRLFFDFMDRDKDGYLVMEDFFANAKALGKSSKASMTARVAFQRDMMSWWVVYQGHEDIDDRVDRETFVQRGWDYLSCESTRHELSKHYSLLFDYIDRDQDGHITEDELLLYYRAHDWNNDSHVRDVFRKLDGNGDGTVTRDELVFAGVQFWCSDDPKAGCDWLYRP